MSAPQEPPPPPQSAQPRQPWAPAPPPAVTPRAGACPACGNPLPPGAPFCPRCGARIAGPARRTPAWRVLLAVLLGLLAIPAAAVGAFATCSVAFSGPTQSSSGAFGTFAIVLGIGIGAGVFALCIWGMVKLLK